MWANLILASFLIQQPSPHTPGLSAKVVDAIDHNYLYADSDTWKRLRLNILAHSDATITWVDQQLLKLNDGDLRIVTAEQMAAIQAETAGKERGAGLVDFAVTVEPGSGDPEVVTPLVDSPAWKAGLQPGDVIESVNGKSTHGIIHEDVMALLRGSSGTLKMVVRRGERKLSIAIPMTVWNEQVVVSHSFSAGNRHLGYIGVRLFTPDSGELVRKAAQALASEGVNGYILDLRNNPGGYLDAMAVAGSAFTSQNLGWKVKQNGAREPIHSPGKPIKKTRIVVLVNKGTASAAEILAAGLHDTVGARLVGVNTFGRGQIQTFISIGDGAGIIIPEASAESDKGIYFNKGSGLKPDVSISSNTAVQTEDVIYRKAVELLTAD